jgi:hypothetical protein
MWGGRKEELRNRKETLEVYTKKRVFRGDPMRELLGSEVIPRTHQMQIRIFSSTQFNDQWLRESRVTVMVGGLTQKLSNRRTRVNPVHKTDFFRFSLLFGFLLLSLFRLCLCLCPGTFCLISDPNFFCDFRSSPSTFTSTGHRICRAIRRVEYTVTIPASRNVKSAT